MTDALRLRRCGHNSFALGSREPLAISIIVIYRTPAVFLIIGEKIVAPPTPADRKGKNGRTGGTGRATKAKHSILVIYHSTPGLLDD